MSIPGRVVARSPVLALAAWLCLLLCLPAAAQTIELQSAERRVGDEVRTVELPDTLRAAPGDAGPIRATYRMTFRLDAPPGPVAVCTPGLIAHARVAVNGHVINDRLRNPMAPLPRSVDRIRLFEVPAEFVHVGENTLEVEAAGRGFLSVAPLSFGPSEMLRHRYKMRLFAAIVAPAAVAVVVGSLALCMLVLWARRRDPLYGYFGLGALGWSLHSLWSVLPIMPLPGVHHFVWWTTLYTFFVAMLVIFCVRFGGWRWPRFDRTLWALALAAPLLLYGGAAVGAMEAVQEAWLLGWIGIVAVGVAAVARYAWTHRTIEGALLVATGAVSFGFALRDWLVSHRGHDNNPVYLVPYAALLFVALVGWMLINRFVRATGDIERMNAELEQRVDAASAELVRTLEQVRGAKEVAERANRAKTVFLAAASHDLRQPIHALGLYMAALADEPLARDAAELVGRMKGSLQALETMFNALLDVSRMDAGAVIPRPRSFDLAPLLHRLADEFAPLATAKGLRLSVRVAAPAALQALTDPVLVERIVRNLLANAVKYTAAGGVLLSCRQRGTGAARRWRVEVWDTGLGIAEGDRERVFDEFVQVGNPERDRAGGLGLGLAIVRRLCDLLGHRLELHSVLGRGTRFALDLPCTDGAAQGEDTASLHGSVERLGVAVVEDDPEVRDGMRTLLQRWGCLVFDGADAREVLTCVAHRDDGAPQAIVADYRLREGRNGVEAIAELRAACGKDLPALIVSGDSGPQHLAAIQASGLECMSKPLAATRLRDWLVRASLGAQVPETGQGGAR